ncbi:unnamed protein product [Didymodactylos carnosus]|uniref:B box-type domain-containing protein n=1 Tax=Didymodactylos carnosus TaxID=1234261 RepID=A0A815HIA7_9BILA|nr:unnamed protein product [Didymodactylos carnosus]CAF4224243.1 unnamed protein product [Didymodactylos carnosus]
MNTNICYTCNNANQIERAILVCDGCKHRYCQKHYEEHRQHLRNELDVTCDKRNEVQNELRDLTNSPKLLNDITQWEQEMIAKIKETANNIRKEINAFLNEKQSEIEVQIQYVTKQLCRTRENGNYTEQDLEQWNRELEKLKNDIHQLSSSSSSSSSSSTERENIQLEIRQIDWTQMIQVIKPRYNQINIILNNKPKRKIPIDKSAHVGIEASDKHLLYQDGEKKLSLIDYAGGHKQSIEWNYGNIYDICWSLLLNSFIIVTKNNLYTVNVSNLDVSPIRQIRLDKNPGFSRCACFRQTLIITYCMWTSPIDEYDTRDWKLAKRLNIFENKIWPRCIRFINETFVVMLVEIDEGTSHNSCTLEIRQQSNMNVIIQSISLEKTISYSYFVCLSNDHCIILPDGKNYLLIINNKNQQQTKTQYKEKLTNLIMAGCFSILF